MPTTEQAAFLRGLAADQEKRREMSARFRDGVRAGIWWAVMEVRRIAKAGGSDAVRCAADALEDEAQARDLAVLALERADQWRQALEQIAADPACYAAGVAREALGIE